MKLQEFTGKLFEIETTAHIAHLQAKSFSKHIALNELYTGIVDLRDRFIESYQGKYGIIKNHIIESKPEGMEMIPYLTKIAKSFEEYEETLKEGFLKQIIDDINELLYSTIYKLTNLP